MPSSVGHPKPVPPNIYPPSIQNPCPLRIFSNHSPPDCSRQPPEIKQSESTVTQTYRRLGNKTRREQAIDPLTPSERIPSKMSPTTTKPEAKETLPLAVVGAHLTGFTLNRDLLALGATLQTTTKTSPNYRLYELPKNNNDDNTPSKPGLARCHSSDSEEGNSIEIEIWALPLAAVGEFLLTIPSPLGLGTIETCDRAWVKGFICEPYGLVGARDVSEFGGWRAYCRRDCD